MIHGGAGDARHDGAAEDAMRRAVSGSYRMLEAGRTAVDVTEHAVRMMEDSGIFNAGSGSYTTRDGTVEADAGIMDGKTMQCGGVGALSGIKNPVSAARKVMYHSEHTALAGPGAFRFAVSKGLGRHEARGAHTAGNTGHKYGTVGAVVMDARGDLAAAVSTGGVRDKAPGRVGDSAIVGAGYYARNRYGAAVATGNGDLMLKYCIAKRACDLMSDLTSGEAAGEALSALDHVAGGDGGVIAVGSDGLMGLSYNTNYMPVAYMSDGMDDEVFQWGSPVTDAGTDRQPRAET